MAWRKWLVRGLVITITGGLVFAGLLYQRLTNPSAVRRQVLEQLGAYFPGAGIGLESANLRLLGGIDLAELRLSRRDDPDRTTFLHVRSAVIYHDKEQLLSGKLVIRKVELRNPRLRAIRGRDGCWNLSGIVGPVDASKPLPAIVVQQGTIVLEDQQAPPGTPPVAITDVRLTLVNDPLTTVVFEGKGRSEAVGQVQVHGKWHRATGEASFSVEAANIPVGPSLVQCLAGHCPVLVDHLRQLHGAGRVQADVTYRPGATPPVSYDARCQLSEGRFHHALLPWPLEQLQASLRCINGTIPYGEASASAGSTRLKLAVHDLTAPTCPSAEPQLKQLDLRVEHLTVTRELFERLPPSLHPEELYRDYSPAGSVSLTAMLRNEGSGQWSKRFVLQPEDLSISYLLFPYRVEKLSGSIDLTLASHQPRTIQVDLTGQAGSQPVYIRGEIKGERPATEVDLKIWGKNMPLDQKLMAGLAALPRHQEVARSFEPTGRSDFPPFGQADFHAHIRKRADSLRPANHFVIDFHHASVRYRPFPYPLADVSGRLIIQPGHWEAHDFRGSHKGGEFRTRGWGPNGADTGEPITLDIEGTNILLDDCLKAALKEPLQRAWDVFEPAGRIHFKGTVKCQPGQGQAAHPDIELTAWPQDCSVKPRFFPYALSDVRGEIHYARNWLSLHKLRARHGTSVIGLEQGNVYCKPQGGVWAELVDLWGNPLKPDADLWRALPGPLQTACRVTELADPVTLKTLMVIDLGGEPGSLPVIYWDGWLALDRARLRLGVEVEGVSGHIACRGRHDGRQLEGVLGNLFLSEATLFHQPFRKVFSAFEVTREEPHVLSLPGLHAEFFGGEVYGPMRIEFGPALRYQMKLAASQVRLEEFGRHNLGDPGKLSGLATASVYLTGVGGELSGLKGNGQVDVPKGKMANLHPLVDLLKVLGLRWPDRTAFEEAHARFSINGPRVSVSQLSLLGNAISLRGHGEMNLNGTDLNLDFHTDWARAAQMLPPAVKAVPEEISNQLLKIQMRGQLGDVRITKVPVPLVVDPVKKVLKGGKEQ
jgi:hypothetical protein